MFTPAFQNDIGYVDIGPNLIVAGIGTGTLPENRSNLVSGDYRGPRR